MTAITDVITAQQAALAAAQAYQPPVAQTTNADADFAARNSAPGVVRWFDFNDATKMTGPKAANGATTYAIEAGNSSTPIIDTTVMASGTGSLRFDIPSQSGANAAGDFRANFSDDLSVQFGENAEFYVQWRQRFNDAMVNTVFNGAESIKMMGLEAGDTPTTVFGSCEAIGVVITAYYNRRFPIAYNSCTGSSSHGPYAGFYETSGSDYLLENATSPVCSYNQNSSVTPATAAAPGCFTWFANEWMTFETRIKTGARNATTNEFDNSEFQLWGAREGGAPVLLIDWHPGVGGYFTLTANDPNTKAQESFGKVYLLTYMTGKDPTQVHPLAQTWYDELIISRQPIAFPGNQPIVVPRSTTYPAWRQGIAVGTLAAITGTAKMATASGPYVGPAPNAIANDPIVPWQGFGGGNKPGSNEWWSEWASGHGSWQNAVLSFNFMADVPRWVLRQPASNFSAVPSGGNVPYYTDGQRTAAHTYYNSQHISAAKAFDGIERALRVGEYARYSPSNPGGGPIVGGFRCATNTQDPAGYWPDGPNPPDSIGTWYAEVPSICQDPVTEKIYLCSNDYLYCYDPTVNPPTVTKIYDGNIYHSTDPVNGGYPDVGHWGERPSCIDTKRNCIVGLTDTMLYRIGLTAPHAIEHIPLTLPKSSYGNGLIYVPASESYMADQYLFAATNVTATTGAIFSIDPTTGAVAQIATMPWDGLTAGLYNRVAFFPDLHGVGVCPSFANDIMFLATR